MSRQTINRASVVVSPLKTQEGFESDISSPRELESESDSDSDSDSEDSESEPEIDANNKESRENHSKHLTRTVIQKDVHTQATMDVLRQLKNFIVANKDVHYARIGMNYIEATLMTLACLCVILYIELCMDRVPLSPHTGFCLYNFDPHTQPISMCAIDGWTFGHIQMGLLTRCVIGVVLVNIFRLRRRRNKRKNVSRTKKREEEKEKEEARCTHAQHTKPSWVTRIWRKLRALLRRGHNQFAIVLFLACIWEAYENTPYGIARYRLPRFIGDSLLNSLCDVIAVLHGDALARCLTLKFTFILVVMWEVVSIIVFHDNTSYQVMRIAGLMA